jgi:hypothetical protein
MNRPNRLAIFFICGILVWVGSGCIRRTKVVTKPREDQALAGNRGYFVGTPPPSERQAATRTYYETEIEIPTIEMHFVLPKWRREWTDKELYGNRGYLVGGPYQKPIASTAVPPAPPKRPSFFQPRQEPVAPEETFEEAAHDSYTVQRGETLGEISAKVYGTSRRWKQIYEANQDILKDPNRIKPGQVLRIPRGAEPRRTSQSDTVK